MSQEIIAEGDNQHLVIRIYGLSRLNNSQVKELVDYFETKFTGLPLDFINVLIIVVPLGRDLNALINLINIGPNLAFYRTSLGLDFGLFETLRNTLIFWREKLKLDPSDQSLADEEIDFEDPVDLKDDQQSSSLPKKVNIDQLLKEFKADKKRRKEKGQA